MKTKQLLTALLALMLFAGCDKKAAEQPSKHVEWAYSSVIYELNTRQFTPEGTFAAAAEQLPMLKELGVDIIWVMPMQPIGIKERKGSLGSYYAIRDYCAVNPEFGTEADFHAFVDKAHELGMKVILDWVANHTSPDHPWTNNPGWHYRDSLGNLTVQYDWTDISKLDYSNPDMRHAMLRSMRWWLDTFGIDGFRCDVASEIPTDFWNSTYDTLRMSYPNLFTLCEAEHPDSLLTLKAFDMYYGWELHHIMNDVAQGNKNVDSLWAYFAKADTLFPEYAIRMNFTSNHDENSWAGTAIERMGDAHYLFTAFTYFIPGMPLIYNGQESALNKRLRFFEKDTIAHNTDTPEFELYRLLNHMRHNNKLMASPERGAKMYRLPCDNPNVFAAIRPCPCGKAIIGIFNMSADTQQATILTRPEGYDGKLPDKYAAPNEEPVEIGATYSINLPAWQWILLQ